MTLRGAGRPDRERNEDPRWKGVRRGHTAAYVALQQAESGSERDRYTATKHRREVGAGHFDDVTQTVTAGRSSVTGMKGSTEEQQFAAGRGRSVRGPRLKAVLSGALM